jgi:hypothetical protein
VKKPIKKGPIKAKPSSDGKGFFGASPVKLLIYGVPGIGKSSVAASFPKPGFVIDPQETGINTLVEFNQVKEPVFIETASDFESNLEFIMGLTDDNRGIETLVLDSLTGFEQLCFKHHCDQNFDGDWTKEGFYSFGKGPKSAAKVDWPRLIDALELVNQAGLNVVILAHCHVKMFNNPEGPDYDRYLPYLDKDVWQHTYRWAQAVLFYNHYVNVTKEQGSTKKKAESGSEQRNLYTTWSPAYEAKNWYGLDPVIDAGTDGQEAFEAFKTAFLEARNRKRRD